MQSLPDYNSNLSSGTLSLAVVDLLHPAQVALGYREVHYRIQQFQAMTPPELDAYLLEHFLPVVIAPDRLPYVVDHHHRARAIQMIGLRKTVYVKVWENCKDWSRAEFWQLMQEKAWVYPFDKNGRSVDLEAIPASLAELQDDQYRSLAWGVLQAGGYAKSEVPFQEFLWGNYFRQHLSFEDTEAGFQQAINETLQLCRSQAASHLPGYIHDAAV
nr:MAG: chromosome partitioning protein ParB [Leptolyngbya sp. IPPAS B-1204]